MLPQGVISLAAIKMAVQAPVAMTQHIYRRTTIQLKDGTGAGRPYVHAIEMASLSL
jgi:hypothetical protein